MLSRLIYLNWSMFLSRMSKLQTVLVIGYIIFLLMLFSNLLGSAVVIALFDSNTMVREQLPWLTMEIRQLILFAFANIFWLLHFSFTSTRLLNMEENRKLLSFSYPVNKLAWHLNLIGFFHPLNIIYNFTWAVFLLIQIRHLWYIPVVLAAVLLNYAIIYSFKHRFLRIIEKRFKIIVFSLVFLLVGTFQAIALILRNPGWFLENYLPDFETVMTVLSYAPGGLLVTSAVHEYDLLTGTVAYSFCAALIFLIFRDHYFKTKEGLHAPVRKETGESKNRLWPFLKRWLGNNAGKFYFYVLIHPYNRLFLLTVVLIPMVYIPLLLRLQNNFFAAILIPTMLAAIPVALLAMGMANMYGYEHREFLVHRQFPASFEKQLKERFLGIITVPLFIFYLITIGEIIFLPELGPVFDIYISNTFYFLCFMLVFLWTSFYYYQKASYSSFSFKHPIVPQKVTFIMTFLMFGLGYAVFAPVGDLQIYRLWVMSGLILAIVVYLWLNMNVLVKAFDRKILPELWYGAVE